MRLGTRALGLLDFYKRINHKCRHTSNEGIHGSHCQSQSVSVTFGIFRVNADGYPTQC
jgi:hypothetical protein